MTETSTTNRAETYKPGGFGCHEALHMAHVCHDMVEAHLCNHEAIELKSEWSELAEKARAALFDLYQAIGAEHL